MDQETGLREVAGSPNLTAGPNGDLNYSFSYSEYVSPGKYWYVQYGNQVHIVTSPFHDLAVENCGAWEEIINQEWSKAKVYLDRLIIQTKLSLGIYK